MCLKTSCHSLRRSVVETSRSLKELFHEARERASKALGFAKMLRKVSLLFVCGSVFLLIKELGLSVDLSLFVLSSAGPGDCCRL